MAGVLLAVIVLPRAWFAAFPVAQPELPAAGRRVAVAPGVSVNVLEAGEGPTLVLVHGHPGSAYEWRPLIDALAERGFRVLAYDRVGYGRSDARPDDDFTVDANARELLALLASEGLDRATVVGWSYGGGVGIAAARLDPDRIGRLVLVGSVGPGIENRPGPPGWLMRAVIVPAMGWAMEIPPLASRLRHGFTSSAFAPGPPPDDLSLVHANFSRPHTLDTMLSEGRDLDGRAPIDPASLALPILVVQGEGDALVPVSVAKELHRRAMGSELWVVEAGSHALPVTHPAELADRIVDFTANPPAAPR